MLAFGECSVSIRFFGIVRCVGYPLDLFSVRENFAAEQSSVLVIAVNDFSSNPSFAEKLDGVREISVLTVMVMEDVEDAFVWLHVLLPKRHPIDFHQRTPVRVGELLEPVDRLAFRIKALELDHGLVEELNKDVGSSLLSSLDGCFPKWIIGLNLGGND